ncbi:hypothetical protein MKX01_041546 [Papaver californicum]|nr:hypothetical protein MKX01_041546 [Papaver californicum]
MASWGIELVSEKPYTLVFDKSRGRLRISKTVDNGAEVIGRVRKFSNGLVIEDLEMNPERISIMATPGSTVLISYVGQLKCNGLVFESSFSKPPFLFKLGAGEVIKGWDIGINSTRIGDKRRLTIPPSLAYGSKGRENVPQDSWVVFDIEMHKILF